MNKLFVSVVMALVSFHLVFAQEQSKPIRLIAEAEDFKIVKGKWEVMPYRENYFASTFALTFLSRMACLSAPEQVEEEAVAEEKVIIPHDGTFDVLARFEQPYDFSVEFTVEIEQKGKVVYKEVFGKLTDPKIWGCSGNATARRVPMQRFAWGGTDNVVWQEKGSVQLSSGEAIIRLKAGPQKDGDKLRLQAARRNVDLICLTDDKEGREAQKTKAGNTYLEMDGWLVQAGDLYIRIKNLGQNSIAPVLAPYMYGQHSPYYVHLRDWPSIKVFKTGYAESELKYQNAGPRLHSVKSSVIAPKLSPDLMKNPEPEDIKLKTGESSGWVPIGHLMDSLNDCKWVLTTKDKLGVEFGIPDGKGGIEVIKTLEVSKDTTFEIPGNIAPNPHLKKILAERWWLPVIRTDVEALNWLLAEVAKFPKKGSTPKRFLIYSIMGFGGGLNYPEGKQLALALGDNTAVNQEGKKRGIVCHLPNPDPEWVSAELAKGKLDDTYIVSYGDETHLPVVKPDDATFKEWLKSKGVPGYDKAVYTTDKNNEWYYYSYLCGVENGAKKYIAGTAKYGEKGILTGANYSPHANYLVTEMHYIRPFKMKALTMPWSEDYVWQIPDFSVQIVGYLTSGLRAGAKYHNMPIHMYVMPHSPGNTPKDFRLSFYTCVANGAKMINYFCASPLAVGSTENYVATADLPMWRVIHDCSHEAGIFEDYVMDGKVREAKVGILLSSVDDIMTGVENMSLALHNNERKALYLALKHGQIPVDFVSEDDVIDGLTKDYNLIYVCQQYLHSKVIKALKKWVENGGVLVAMAGGGFMDEFGKVNKEVGELYGVKEQRLNRDPDFLKYILVENKPFFPKQDLPRYKPIDFASWSMGDRKVEGVIVENKFFRMPQEGDRKVENVGVIGWKQDIVPSDGKVIGKFSDGKPAVIEKVHGKGKAILFGFMPGQEYLRKALPLRPVDRGSCDNSYAHFIPTNVDHNLRKAITEDFLPAGFVKPVEVSEPLIEVSCIDTEKPSKKLAVPLINYSEKKLDNLVVKISGIKKISKIRSVEHEKINYKIEDDKLVITMPLNLTDMLLIDL